MAAREPRDLLNRLADAGEDAIQRLAETPGADRLLAVANAMRGRMDDRQKRMRGIDALEGRIAELERQLEELSGGSKSKAPARRSASAAAKSTTSKASAAKSSATKPSSTKASSSKGSSSKSSGSAKKSSGSSRGSSSSSKKSS